MRQLRYYVLGFVCLFAVTSWAQGSPTVYVSTGSAGKIYSLNTANGNTNVLVSTSGADYEGMVVGPDNAAGTTHPYVLYACDSANNKIVRFDPTAATPISPEVIYSGGSLSHPQCGRVTSTGDLVVSSKDSGSGLWIFSGITGVELGSAGAQTPTQLSAPVAGSGQGVAQKNNGDLLVVDSSNKKVVRTTFPSYISSSDFITGLSAPVGISRRSDGAIFVSDQGSSSILRYNAQGQSVTTCQSFKKKDVPFFLQGSLDDTLYVAITSNTSGVVNSVNGSTCKLLKSFSLPDPAVGIALPPTTASQNVVASKGSALVNFGFTALELNQIVGSCSGSVGVSLLSPEQIKGLIQSANLPNPADPAVNLGLDGFEAVISTANLNGCTAKDGATLNFQTAYFVDEHVANPQIVVCSDDNSDCQPASVSLAQIGVWPLGGYLPEDIATGGTKSLKCNIFAVNAHQAANTPGQEDGTFCGFQSPVSNTFDFSSGIQNPALAANFSAGKSVPVKFKLAPGNNSNCQSAPYVTDAVAILSVAQIADSKGSPTFVPIGLISNGSSGLGQPLFKSDSNQQYLFNWDSGSCIMPSGGAAQTCPKGRYSLTVVFLTNNTANSAKIPPQSIYNVQTTEVVLK